MTPVEALIPKWHRELELFSSVKPLLILEGNISDKYRYPVAGSVGEDELVPIDTVASSHLARRTFIGNAYFKVSDPNLIGRMSGHVDGSRAFKRYRNIEDETLKSVIDLIG